MNNLKKFSKFYFEKFSFDKKTLKASFFYSFDKLEFFEEIIDFSFWNNEIWVNLNYDELINNYLFNLHISLWISYYKLFPTKELIIESWYLDEEQIDFWKKFYLNWLWEFLIKNKIDFDFLFNFVNTKNVNNYHFLKIDNYNINSNKSLLLWWWGKDSIVSYSLLKNVYFDIFVVGKLDKIKENTINLTNKIPKIVNRKLSQNLFLLNEKWYFNWHVPITWIIAFLSLFYSYLYNYKYIILSNEKSSSEENIIWKSLKINHQYSKSSEFEIDFWNYIDKYLSKNIKYFSLLRWMYEYKIAEIFSKQDKFFYSFSSCNNNFKINKSEQKNNWCWNCEKCCFVFLILSNFIDIFKLEKIFWKNLFLDNKLEEIFIDLIWFWKNKPFECVWTYEESLLSIHNAIKKYNKNNFYILEKISKIISLKQKNYDFKNIENKLLNIYNEDIIPLEFKKLLN